MKRPAYQWYPGDADSDEVFKLMTYEQEGIYRRLIDHQWVEGSIPRDPQVLASLLPKIDRARFLEIWPLISCKFRPRGNDRLVNDKLETQRREREKFLRSQTRKSAKGVAVRKLQAQKTQPVGQPVGQPVKGAGLTSSSSSSSSSSTKNTEQYPPVARGAQNSPLIANGGHRSHAICGKVCLPGALMESLKQRMAHLGETEALGYISRFYADWNARYTSGDRADVIVGEDAFDFWRQRWQESHPTAPKSAARKSSQFLADVADLPINIVTPGKAVAS